MRPNIESIRAETKTEWHTGDCETLLDYIDELEKIVSLAKKFVKLNDRHAPHCNRMRLGADMNKFYPCDCGFDRLIELLAALDKPAVG